MFKNAFSNLQKVGKALMLPVSVLPVAGILLGVGAAHFKLDAGNCLPVDGASRWFRIWPDGPAVRSGCCSGLYQ